MRDSKYQGDTKATYDSYINHLEDLIARKEIGTYAQAEQYLNEKFKDAFDSDLTIAERKWLEGLRDDVLSDTFNSVFTIDGTDVSRKDDVFYEIRDFDITQLSDKYDDLFLTPDKLK